MTTVRRRQWERDKRERIYAYQAKWRAANKERLREQRLARRAADPEKHRGYSLRHRYGIGLAQYDTLLRSQDGGCALCRQPPDTEALSVDHDHACCPGERSCGRCIRGLLCRRCNIDLGHLENRDATWFAATDAYLRATRVSLVDDHPRLFG